MGLVLDAKLTSKQFLQALPPTEKPMPMAEPAMVVGVSDAAKLVKALGEYREVINGFIELARGIEPRSIPPFEIPPPLSEKTEVGTLYYYPLPEQLGLDPKVLPNAGLSDKVAVSTATREHTARLLAATPPRAGRRAERRREPPAGHGRLAGLGRRWSTRPPPGSTWPPPRSSASSSATTEARPGQGRSWTRSTRCSTCSSA